MKIKGSSVQKTVCFLGMFNKLKNERRWKEMRKTSVIMLFVLLGVVLISGSAYAVEGVCSNCHTMHNSQGGTSVTSDGITHDFLLLASCIGCHTGTFRALGTGAIPKVDGTDTAPFILAGGTFDDTATYADSMTKRHDVTDLFPGGDTIMAATPGNGGDSILTVSPTELRCAGSKGCHGRHTTTNPDAAIKGFHHGADSFSGYRFLWYTTSDPGSPVTGKGVSGYEADGATASSHNVYSADPVAGISASCGICHGQFHDTGDTGANSPFTRHPTDRALVADAGWAWNSFGWGSQAAPYDNTPLAFLDISVVNTNTAYFTALSDGSVMCLSCHRAHGSKVEDILRWTYDSQAGSGDDEKCLACHYKQRQ